MRNFVLGFGLLALASTGAAVTAVTAGAAQGPRGGETIRVYQSPT